MSNGKESTAITAAGQRRMLPLSPASTDDAWRLAELLAKSAIIPQDLRNKPNDVLVMVLLGHELGIGPMQAIRKIDVIKGKPQASAELMVALCKQHPACRYFRYVDKESDDKRATYVTHRVGEDEPTKFTFTIEDAKKLGLLGNDNWTKQPKTMLRARASSALARIVYPDIVQGLYAREEMEDAIDSVSVVQAPKTLSDLTQRLKEKSAPAVLEVHVENSDRAGGTEVTPDEAAELLAAEREPGQDDDQ